MPPPRHFLAAICAFVVSIAPVYSVPQTFGEPPQAVLRGDGSVLIKPGETISLKIEVQDGKITKFAKLPWDTKETEGVISISLSRTGGVATSLGPISPITDSLSISGPTGKSFSARCEYTTLSAPKPERTRLSGKDGRLQKSFRWGVSHVTISEIQFKP